MRQLRAASGVITAATLYMMTAAAPLKAEPTDLCVTCADPGATYVCRVDTPGGSPGEKALQLYCIVKTAKLGGHSACSVRRGAAADCNGRVVSHVYEGPVLPRVVREISPLPGTPAALPAQDTAGAPPPPPQRGGEPETLVEMTAPAVRAGRAAARSTSRAVRNAASGTGDAIGSIGKRAGRGVSYTAKSAGEATRDAGSAIGNAARYTYGCVTSLFRNCGGSSTE